MPNTRGQSRGSHPKSSTSRSIPTGRGGSSIVGRGSEIANEWSQRGRGNNISSGNDRYIPDECIPIGRGSNNTSRNGSGRADDCSPRGRGNNNTSGNGMGITDDISPRGRRSTNRDISDDCSLIGRAISSIDNEEHVEHVIGSSQNQVYWVIIYINPLNLLTVSFGVDAAIKLKEKHSKCLLLPVKILVLSEKIDAAGYYCWIVLLR
nr:hypothetical protein [Tanacetum cinerariifolium]